MNHPFMASIDFQKLEKKELDPPYKPEITDDIFDVSNFDQELTSVTKMQDRRISIMPGQIR